MARITGLPFSTGNSTRPGADPAGDQDNPRPALADGKSRKQQALRTQRPLEAHVLHVGIGIEPVARLVAKARETLEVDADQLAAENGEAAGAPRSPSHRCILRAAMPATATLARLRPGARAQDASIESRYCGVMPASLRILP
jgi:hypothetical protein